MTRSARIGERVWPWTGALLAAAIGHLPIRRLLPLGGLLMAVFAGWFMRSAKVARELHTNPGHWLLLVWLIGVRFIAPVGVVFIFLNALGAFGG